MSRPVCPRCNRPSARCLCPLIPSLPSATRVVVLQHPDEARHALNTARLAVLGLPNARLLVGEHFEPDQWQAAGYAPHLLFPGADARVLAADGSRGAAPQAGPPCLLVVPDGTWRHARTLLRNNPGLAALPCVALPQGSVSRYRVRQAREPGALSTLEAIVQALNALEAPALFDALLRPFEALVQGQIAAMGLDVYERHHVRRQGTRSR